MNNTGEGHINTGIMIIIAVVIGALLLAGLYALFSGNNGLLNQVDRKIDHMSNLGGQIALKVEDGILKYSYDKETWKDAQITGMDSASTVSQYMTIGQESSLVHLVTYKRETGVTIACYSLDGVEWIPFNSDPSGLSISKKSNGSVYLHCNDGRSYYSQNGITWSMTSTKRYLSLKITFNVKSMTRF